jgi:HK97 family phage portal protein
MGWFSRLLGSSAEPAQSRYVDDWLKGMDIGSIVAAGVRVSVKDALAIPSVAACIQVLSEDLAKVPLELKRRTPSGFESATDHPLYGLLKFGPALWLSSYVWRETLARAILSHGNGYSLVRRDDRGQVERIINVQSPRVTVRWADEGEPFYDVSRRTGIERGLTWQDVVHVPYRSSMDECENGGIIGISPIMQNRQSIGLAIATERFAAAYFRHGARPSLALEMDQQIPNKDVGDRIRSEIERVYAGVDSAQKIMVLELGMKLKELSSNPSESQMTETRKEQAVQACTMFRVPPHKIGILDKATFSNIEQQSIDYVTGPVSALAKSIEAAITVACLTPEERETYKVEHNLEGLMRGDILSRYRAYAIGRQWGWLSADDVRETENRNKLPNGAGEEYLVPLNMIPAGSDPMRDDERDREGDPQQDPAQPDKSPDAAWMPAVFHAVNPKFLKPADQRLRLAKILGPHGEHIYLKN